MKIWGVVVRSLMVSLAGVAAMSLAGCSGLQMQATSGPAQIASAGVRLQGSVHGGNQPISGATIQLYATGTTGYGSAATALIPVADQVVYSGANTGAMTNASGSFSITGDYSCPSGSQVYLTATGGNPGLGGSVNNAGISLIAALGPCSALSPTTFINVSEVTTVAAVWALQQFIGVTAGTTLAAAPGINGAGTLSTPAFTIGTSSANAQGLVNAMQWANVLATTATGLAPASVSSFVAGSGNKYTPEYWQVNLLGNILSYCVNSSSATSGNCSTLFSDTATIGGTAPADTLQAAYAIATNPVYNVNSLFALASPQAAFSPVPTAVNDFTILVTAVPTFRSNLYLNTGADIKFDQYGNAWVPSTCHGQGTGVGTALCATNGGITTGPDLLPIVSEFSALGDPIGVAVTSYNLNGTTSPIAIPYEQTSGAVNIAVGVDTSNNAWVTDYQDGLIFKIPGSTSAGGLNGDFAPTVANPTTTGTITGVPSITNSLATFTATNSLVSGQMVVPSGFTGSSNTFLNNGPLTVVTANSTSFTAYVLQNASPSTTAAGTFTAYPLLYAQNTAVSLGANSYPYSLTIDGNSTVWFATGLSFGDSGQTIGTWASGDTFPTGNIRSYGGFTTSNGTPGSGFYANISPGYATTYQMAVDMTPSSTYAGAPFLWADDSVQGSYGDIHQIFTNAATVGSTTVAQGMHTPLSPFSASEGNGVTKIADTTTASYGGSSTIDAYASNHGEATLIDGGNNVWILNYNVADSASSNYPKYSLSKISQSAYSTTASGALTEAAAPTVQVYTSNTFSQGGTANIVPTSYMALDGASNVWLVGTSGTTVPATGVASTTGFIEFNDAGTDLTAGTNSAGTSVSNGFVGASAPSTYVRGSVAKRAVAVDLSGNVWSATTNTGGNAFVMLIGQASPAIAPISSAIANHTLGQRP